VFHMFFLTRYCRDAGGDVVPGRTADFLFMLVLGDAAASPSRPLSTFSSWVSSTSMMVSTHSMPLLFLAKEKTKWKTNEHSPLSYSWMRKIHSSMTLCCKGVSPSLTASGCLRMCPRKAVYLSCAFSHLSV